MENKKKKIIWILLLFISPVYANIIIIPEVTSGANGISHKKTASPLFSTQIERDDIKTSPVTNLEALLQQQQSIVRLTHNSGDSSQTALSIRGFGDNASANSLILVDGFPLINPSLLAPNFNSIPLVDIERIEIFQGSEGTLWGDQAVGGVMNIVTRHPQHFIGDVNLSAGSFNQHFYSGFAGSRFANGFFFKGFDFANRTNNDRQHNRETDENVAAQFGLDHASGSVSFNIQAYDNTVQFPGGLTEAQFSTNPHQATNFQNYVNYKTRLYQLLVKQSLLPNWLLELRADNRIVNGDGMMYSNFTRSDEMNTIHPRLIASINKNKFILGYQFQSSQYHLENTRVYNQANASQQNLYSQITIPFLDKLTATIGARAAKQHNNAKKTIDENINSNNQVLVTEQGLALQLTDQLQLFVRRDGNFSFPKANEETWTPASVNALQAQIGTSYETGATFKTHQQTAQLNMYRLELHNEIAFDPTSTISQPFGSFRNFPNTLRRGVTLTERYTFSLPLTFETQLNYVDARFADGEFAGNMIPAVPAFNANINFAYMLNDNWELQYYALYTGSRFASNNTNNIGKKLAGYWLNSASIQYILSSLRISFEIANLFNQGYSAYTLFDPIHQTNTYYPGAGRSFLLSLKASVD